MMSEVEVPGIAAIVPQLADAAARLSVKLFTISLEAKVAQKGISQLSQHVASTGAALRQLGGVLEDAGVTDLGSENAIATANQLLADCWQVFGDISEVVGDGQLKAGGSGEHQIPQNLFKVPASFSLRRRLRFPFKKSGIKLLTSKVEGLKSSLMLMLQVLGVASQIKSGPQVIISDDQQWLIHTLVKDRKAYDKDFARLMGRLQPVADDSDSDNESIFSDAHTAATITKVGTSTPIYSRSASSSSSDDLSSISLVSDYDDWRRELPRRIELQKQEIEQHALLTQNLAKEVGNPVYKLSHGTRHKVERAILSGHYRQWVQLAWCEQEFEALLNLFSQHEMVAKHWNLRYHNEDNEENEEARRNDAIRHHGYPPPVYFHPPPPPPPPQMFPIPPPKPVEERRPIEKLEPIKFKGENGRNLVIPWDLGRYWAEVRLLINKTFDHLSDLSARVYEGKYDLIGPESNIILPELWDATIEPGMTVSMVLWPLPEPTPEFVSAEDEAPPLPAAITSDGLIDLEALLEPQRRSRSRSIRTLSRRSDSEDVIILPRRHRPRRRSRYAPRVQQPKPRALSRLLLDWTTLSSEEVSEAVGLKNKPSDKTGDVDETQNSVK